MTEIDFYIIDQAGASAREQLACRIAEKAYERGLRVLLLTADDEQSARLDRLLWTFRQGSFIPHAVQPEREGEPVTIGQQPELSDDPVLINLTDTVPHTWAQRQRLSEIIDQRESVVTPGRQRYKSYQQHGHKPRTHRIGEGRER
ncbi:hypothetical protein CKO15_05755 [Halorhodospira abdelmalekii]|uniref:DNA polymerase III subunit chi n=1 Tax=Halorhodospira abdelmalekii TaxID=421629 RepID=UPI001905359D|nr:hypothetical protein [Halorhodospira abdelmalekii]